jgi:hypothetical protein
MCLLKQRAGEVYAVNRFTIELFNNVGGNLFPFARNEGAQLSRGAIGTHCAPCTWTRSRSSAAARTQRHEPPAVWIGLNGSTRSCRPPRSTRCCWATAKPSWPPRCSRCAPRRTTSCSTCTCPTAPWSTTAPPRRSAGAGLVHARFRPGRADRPTAPATSSGATTAGCAATRPAARSASWSTPCRPTTASPSAGSSAPTSSTTRAAARSSTSSSWSRCPAAYRSARIRSSGRRTRSTA